MTDEIEKDQQHSDNMEEARRTAPERCKNCDHLSYEIEDNRFDVLARFKGDRTIYGNIEVVPWCEKYEDICDKIK